MKYRRPICVNKNSLMESKENIDLMALNDLIPNATNESRRGLVKANMRSFTNRKFNSCSALSQHDNGIYSTEYRKPSNKRRGLKKSVSFAEERFVEDMGYGSNDSVDVNTACIVTLTPQFYLPAADSGHCNKFFELTNDGRDELPQSVVRTFGQKGRAIGRLQDVSSVVTTDSEETVVADFVNNKIQVFNSVGQPTRQLTICNQSGPWNVVTSPHGWIGVTFRNSKTLSILTVDGSVVFHLDEEKGEPCGLAVDMAGRYIVTDVAANCVSRLTLDEATGQFHKECLANDNCFKQPRYVAVSPNGNIVVSDSGNHCVKVLSPSGVQLLQFGQYGRRRGDFRCPYGVCVDRHGNIMVADHYNKRVSMFSDSGTFIRHLVSEGHGLGRPQSLHLSTDDKLYVTHGSMKANEVMVFDIQRGSEVYV